MFRNIFLVSGLTLFTAVASAQSLSSSAPDDTAGKVERQKPAASIQEQPGAPLRITSLKTKWATPDQQVLEIYAVVENVSEMDVRAYALRAGAADDLQNIVPCLLNNIQSPGKILRPGDSASKSTWRRVSLESPSKTIDLSLDFVEFADGITWGTDACQSAERLRGLRAGALAAKDKLVKMQTQDNSKPLINLLKVETPVLEAPEGQSPVWLEGFQGGVRTLFERVRKANEEGGLPEVERVLRLPFDASDNK